MKHKNDVDFNARLYGKQKFGFRKLSVGLAAVALGTTFLMTNGELVHADATDSTQASQTEEVKSNEAPQSTKKENSDTQKPEGVAQSDQHQVEANSEYHKSVGSGVTPPISSEKPKNDQDEHTDSDPKNQTVETQTISTNDLDNASSSAVYLEENKTPEHSPITITASRDNQTINKTQDMMAGQDTVDVHINIDSPQLDAHHQLIIKLPDAGNAKNFNVSKSSTKITSNNGQSYWNVDVDVDDNNSQISATWNSNNNETPQNFKLDLPVQGNSATVKSSIDNQSFNVEINDQTKTAFTANLTPYKEKVTEDEILKGFPMGEKTFDSVNGSWPEKNNMSPEDIKKYNLNKDSKILQWGIYFNYGNQLGNTNLKPLVDAVFRAYFDGDQTLIPSSIKVFEVPDGMAVDNNGYRDGVDNFYVDPKDQTQNQKYYNKITVSNNERPAFEQYLKDHVTTTNGKPNGFSVDQTKDSKDANGHVPFHIPGDPTHDYSTHAYFIQLDTVMKDDKRPGDGTRINYEASQGLDSSGKQISTGNNWLNGISGSSGSHL
ncbi:YSIRK-type signal peptide-containing protein, partial [Lactobacillus hamsteri]